MNNSSFFQLSNTFKDLYELFRLIKRRLEVFKTSKYNFQLKSHKGTIIPDTSVFFVISLFSYFTFMNVSYRSVIYSSGCNSSISH